MERSQIRKRKSFFIIFNRSRLCPSRLFCPSLRSPPGLMTWLIRCATSACSLWVFVISVSHFKSKAQSNSHHLIPIKAISVNYVKMQLCEVAVLQAWNPKAGKKWKEFLNKFWLIDDFSLQSFLDLVLPLVSSSSVAAHIWDDETVWITGDEVQPAEGTDCVWLNMPFLFLTWFKTYMYMYKPGIWFCGVNL